MSKIPWAAYRIWRECGRKKKYKHEGQAKREAHKLGLRAYACTKCDGFHLTKRET